MAIEDRVSAVIEPTLNGMGYEIVRVKMIGSAKDPTLQIMAERVDGKAITLEDCELISHTVSAQLDVADPIKSAYRLEVSSPGLDRPLTRLKDFTRFAGFEAKIQTKTMLDNQRNFKGTLAGVEGEQVVLEVFAGKEAGNKKVLLNFSDIDQARLVMNDALIKAAQENRVTV